MLPLVIREPDFNWESMLKWWNAHSDGSHTPLREEEDENFMESIAKRLAYAGPFVIDAVDIVHQTGLLFNPKRGDLQNIHKSVVPRFRDSPVVLALKKLDQLLFYAEYVNVSEALHEIGVLDLLLDTVLCWEFPYGVYNQDAGVRAKAAEVVTAMVQDNPSGQQLVMEVNGLLPLFCNFTTDPDLTSRTKALGAISALIRNNKPGINAFLHLDNCYGRLSDALRSESVEFQREALNLTQYLLHENSFSDCNIFTELGSPHIVIHLTSSYDAQVREAALRVLLVLARDEAGNQMLKNDAELNRVLHELIKGISAMAPEDLGAAKEEIQLVDSLWNACYNKPSSLVEKGLLVLPGC